MASLLHNFLLFFSCFSLLIFLSSATIKSRPRPQIPIKPNRLVLKVQKDRATNLHVAQIYKRNPPVQFPFVIDLNGKFLSVNCENQYLSTSYNAPVCHSTQCARANSHMCRTCSSSSGRPGCHNNACALMTMNPVTRQSAMGELAEDVLTIQSTQGSNPGPMVTLLQFLFACAPSNILQKGLPKKIQGFAGLGHSPISLPYQLASHFGFPPKFALCLASQPGQNGVVFFGEGPYILNPGIDVSRQLTYTPLTISQQGEYFINVQSIKISNKIVPLNQSLLPFSKRGMSGTMISTTNPYTILQTSIFRAVTQQFINQLRGVPQVKAVGPFGVCFDARKIPSSKIGPTVPSIDLVLDKNRNIMWRIFGQNALVQPRPGVMCLGFVDGGVRPQASIILGAKQLEDNLLQFDLANSRLGFSSSLLLRRTNCANFYFGRSSSAETTETTETTETP